MSCGVGHRHGSDPALLWLWCRPAAVALIQPVAWKLPYAAGVPPQKKEFDGVSAVAQWVKNPTAAGSGRCRSSGLIPSLEQWVKGPGFAAAML